MKQQEIANDLRQRLCEEAVNMRRRSYVPYSHFSVGAAILTKDGKIYTGCNIENASYPAGICAERTAIFKAVSEGEMEFSAIAIAGGPNDGELQYCPPCGVCRQVMSEYCGGDFRIYLAKSATDFQEYTLDEILPMRFTPDNLIKAGQL